MSALGSGASALSGGFGVLGIAGAIAGAPASVQALLQTGTLAANLFAPASRYAGIATAMLTSPDGQVVIYIRRRFVPDPSQFALLQEHVVMRDERPDTITARYLGNPGDPQQFWRLADANRVLRPEELTEQIGNIVRITLPQGIPGPSVG